jgi:hypothetical protein
MGNHSPLADKRLEKIDIKAAAIFLVMACVIASLVSHFTSITFWIALLITSAAILLNGIIAMFFDE